MKKTIYTKNETITVLSICASGQNLAQADPFQMAAELKSARESLSNSLANLDIMLGLIEQIEHL